MDFTRLFDILPYQQLRYPQKNALAGRGRDGSWRTWSTEAALSERDRLSAGLLQMGFRKGDCVGMLTHCGSPEWVIADAAMMQIGIVPVPIHATARLDEIAHITRDAHLRACWVSNLDLYKKFVMAGESTPPAPIPLFSFESIEGAVSWNEIACDPDQHDLEKIEYYRQGIRPEDLATLLYTSGTTGAPKGVMLSHYNIVSNIKSVMAIVPIDRLTTTVSYLPMSHIFERTVCYLYQAAGASVWFADAVETLPQTLREVRPHFFTAVPRILERTYERLLEMRSKSGFIGKKVLDWAIKLGQNYPFAGAVDMPFLYRMQWMLADALVYRRWRKAMGGRLKGIAVGAAALQPRLGRLFSAAGIDVREGYGLTETSPVISFNRFEPGGVHFGTVGIPLPGVEVRIAPTPEMGEGEGEVEVRGPNVMMGYYHRPEETAARFTSDGWLRTGDLGRFERKRFLRITGRISEVFKTTTGKFVAPAFVEQQLLASPYIDQCMVTGLNRPFVVALIAPNFEQLEAWCRENKVHWTAPEFMILNPKVEKMYRRELDRINETALGAIEKVKYFHLIADAWTMENGLLTPTLKLRRNAIEAQYADAIAALYKSKK